MKIELINDNLLSELHQKAGENERLRQNYDLRTTPEDTSQRMLNALEPGTHVPIHRHLKTSETVICLEGCLDEVFTKNCLELIRVVLFLMEKRQQMRRSLQRWQDSASALENRNMASRYPKVYGIAS